MASIKIRFLVTRPGKDGAVRYFWQPGKKLAAQGFRLMRLPDEQGAAIAEAQRLNEAADNASRALPAPTARPIAKAETVDDGIKRYKASRYYQSARATTRRFYDQKLAIISAWCGDSPWRAVSAPLVEKFYMKLHTAHPTQANHVIATLRVLLSFLATGKLRQPNAASAPGLIGVEPGGVIWPAEAVQLFVESADQIGAFSIGTAVMFNDWLGQREADILRMKPPRLANGAIVLRQRKLGAGVMLPIAVVPRLAARLEAELARRTEQKIVAIDGSTLPLILDERTGAPYTEHTFRKRFAEVRAIAAQKRAFFPVDYIVAGSADEDDPRIATKDLWFMHLRHTAVVRNAEAGADDTLISALTGHSLVTIKQILKHYLVRTGEMVRVAFAKRLEKERRDKEQA